MLLIQLIRANDVQYPEVIGHPQEHQILFLFLPGPQRCRVAVSRGLACLLASTREKYSYSHPTLQQCSRYDYRVDESRARGAQSIPQIPQYHRGNAQRFARYVGFKKSSVVLKANSQTALNYLRIFPFRASQIQS